MYTVDLCSDDLCIALDYIELWEKIMTLGSERVSYIFMSHLLTYDLGKLHFRIALASCTRHCENDSGESA